MRLQELSQKILEVKRPVTTIVSKSANSRLIAVGLGEGVILKDHTAPGLTRLFVIQGAITYNASGYSKEMNRLDEFDIPLEEVHWVEAKEPSIFLLIVTN